MSREPYFALLPREDIGRRIISRVQQYYANTRVTEILAKQRVAYRYYYDLGLNWAGWGTPGTTNMMQRGGDEGELALIRINHFRNLVRNQVAMISNAKFDRRPRAASDDYEPAKAAELCGFVLDHYKNTGGLELLRLARLESASVMGEGFTHYGWNESRGREYAVDPSTKRREYTGDVEATNVMPWDVVRNPYKGWREQLDVTVRFPNVSKWVLAAKYPDHAEAILEASPQTIVPFYTPIGNTYDGPVPNDVEIFVFYHLPCPIPGLEDGKVVTVLGTGLVLDEQRLLLRRFPLVRVAEAEVMGSPFGYASCWEYSGIQELYDNLQSIVATNQSTHGAQNIAIKSGVDPRPLQLEGGMNVFVCNDPKNDVYPLQLTKSPAEIFPHMQDLVRNMEKLSGSSQVDRGEAQGDRQAASALALLSAQTIRNASPYQTSDVEGLKEESQIILRTVRLHAKRPITIGVAEADRTPYERSIHGNDLGETDDVDIDLVNPLMQTPEGRVAVLQTLAQLKIELDPKQAMEVVARGRLEPVTDAVTKEGLRIRLENKLLREGKVPRAIVTDDAIRHCREHAEVLSDGGRDIPEIHDAVFEHIYEHYRAFFGTDPEQDKALGTYRPNIMVLCGLQPPPPSPMPGGMPPPLPGEAVPGGAPPPEGSALPPPGPAQGPTAVLGNGAGARLPKPPKNAATGERWTPVSGGGTPA